MNALRYPKSLIAVALAALLSVGVATAREWSEEYEKQVGDRTAAEIAKEYKVYENEEQQQRVEKIVADLAAHTQRPDVAYQVVLLDDEEVNAFSVPGGHIYIYKGVLNAVESEAQLAGIIAHEMAHNCTYDVLDQLKRAHDMSLATAVALILSIATGRSDDTTYGVLTAGQVVTRGILSKYSIEIESRADRNALSYLLGAGYNPVGLLTFMERLAREERSRPTTELGIFQTHPLSTQRVSHLTHLIQDAGVEINRRAVTKWDPPIVEEGEVGGRPAQILKLWDQELFAFADAPDEGDVTVRGQRMVEALTQVLRDGARAFEFRTVSHQNHTAIAARDKILFTIYPEDAALVGKSVADTAMEVNRAFRRALFWERIQRLY